MSDAAGDVVKKDAGNLSEAFHSVNPDMAVDTYPDVKPGVKTSEFWLTSIAKGIGLVTMILGILEQTPAGESSAVKITTIVVGALIQVLSLLGYQASRAKVKA